MTLLSQIVLVSIYWIGQLDVLGILRTLLPLYIYINACIVLCAGGVSGPAQHVKGAVQPARFFSSTPTMVLCQWYCTICTTLTPSSCCTRCDVRAMYLYHAQCWSPPPWHCVNGSVPSVPRWPHHGAVPGVVCVPCMQCYCVNGSEANVYH